MAKPKIQIRLKSFGLYEKWDRDSKILPKLIKFCTEVPAIPGIEFGYILEIKKGKGKRLEYRIEHPPFKDSTGQNAPPFKGEVYVNSNDWQFFLGDTIWEPVYNKIGTWRLITRMDGKTIADKTIIVTPNT